MMLAVACVGILDSLGFWPTALSAFYLFHLPHSALKNAFSIESQTGVENWMICSWQYLTYQ